MKKFLKKLFSIKSEDNHIILTISGIKLKFRNYEIGKQRMNWRSIIDSAPDSFKDYVLKHNMPQEIELLKKNLDKDSLNVIDISLKKILQLPDAAYAKFFYIDENEFRTNFETSENKNYDRLLDENVKLYKKYKLSKDEYDYEVFIYHHGLRFANQKTKEYVKNKDFIDAGAYIGDSALVFMDYLPNKIYSFEISDKSIAYYKKTMEINNIPTSKYLLVESGLSDKEGVINVIDNGDLGVTIYNDTGNQKSTISLDSFLNNIDCNIGFIKADIEGAMYKALSGMQKTIKKYRPVLSLAIYHSPEEFFKTKPLLDEITQDLNYTIKIDCHYSQCYHIYGTIIWAYPAELDN